MSCFAKTTDAARLLVIFDHDPLGATAIDDLFAMRQVMPQLVAESGLSRRHDEHCR